MRPTILLPYVHVSIRYEKKCLLRQYTTINFESTFIWSVLSQIKTKIYFSYFKLYKHNDILTEITEDLEHYLRNFPRKWPFSDINSEHTTLKNIPIHILAGGVSCKVAGGDSAPIFFINREKEGSVFKTNLRNRS